MRKPKIKTAAVKEEKGSRRATSYDVARRVGVSQATVSRCFKEGSRVSLIIRKRVLEVANEMGYRPNAIARSLITKRSNLVAIVISNLTNLYYPEVLSELSRHLSERGVRVLLFTLPRETDIDLVLEQIWQYRVDGVIAAARLSQDQVKEFKQHNVPFVFFNRRLGKAFASSVYCNQLQGTRELVKRLHAAGHKRYAIISGPSDSFVAQERLRGSLASLRKIGAAAPLIVDGDSGYDGGVRGMQEVMKRMSKAPDAIICTSDMAALGCLDSARYDFGLKVPKDLSIVGFDGVNPAYWRPYQLTTLRQPMHDMAEAAAAILMAQIEDSSLPPETRQFNGEVIVGESARLG